MDKNRITTYEYLVIDRVWFLVNVARDLWEKHAGTDGKIYQLLSELKKELESIAKPPSFEDDPK